MNDLYAMINTWFSVFLCQHGYIYEVITLTPEIKNRLKEIHTKIAELNEELEQLCTFNPVQSSSRTGTE